MLIRRRLTAYCLDLLGGVLLSAVLAGGSVHGWAQTPGETAPALPANYRVVFENSTVQVIHVHYGPHEKVAMHDHSADPTVYVYLSDSGPVRFTHAESRAEGGAGVLTRPPIKAGAFRVSPGRRERHSVENLGDIPSDFLRVELKSMPFATLEAFRGEAPPDLHHSATVQEVKSAQLEVDRVVCAEAKPCSVAAASAASLLVAFTPAALEGGSRTLSLRGGEVAWVQAGQSFTVRAPSGGPVHLLRIVVPGRAAHP